MRSPIFEHAADMYREMRREFDVVLEAAYAAAEEGTHGSLLNALGRREPVTAFSLLTGPWSRVEKYGSPELIEWFNRVGRPSVLDFEREWLHARWQMPWPLLTDDEPDPDEELREAFATQARISRRSQEPEPDGEPTHADNVIATALDVAGPARMMDRDEACRTLNDVLDVLRAAER